MSSCHFFDKSKSTPILRALIGHKRDDEFEKGLQFRIVKRLLDAAAEYDPERIKPLKSSSSSLPEPKTGLMVLPPATSLAPEPVAADIPCSLIYGSWRCQCARCLLADIA